MAELRSFAGEITMLADMGFADLDANQRLLVENDGNVQAVLDELLAMQFDAGREPAAPPGEGGGEGPEAPPPVGAGGAAAGAAAEYDFDDVPPPVPPALLRRQTSAALIDFFAERGLTEREVLPEYRAAWRAMCLDHALLSSSREGKALARLNDAIAARPLGDFSAVVEGAIRKAYALGPGASARGQKCMVEGYTIFDNVAAVHAEVGWRAKYVHASLRGLSEAMEPGQLIGLLATLTKGGHECLTRKRYAASTLIDLYPEGGAGLVGGDECPFGLKVSCPEGSSAPDGEGPVRRMAAAKQSLLAATEAWLDEHKDRAFDAAFIRPTRCYERATGGDEISEGNAKVHGGNTYSAVVLACLGVALPQRPYLADHHSQGRRAFLRSAEKCPAFSAVVDALVEPKNLGRDVPAVRSVRLPSDARSEQGFIFSGDTPRAIACGALDPSPANAPRRAELARYLARFAALLSAEVVLEPLFVRLYEERREVLALPCRALRAAGVGCWARGEGEDEEDVATKDYRLWVFNEELDYAFDGARALLLFAALGIIRPELHPPDTAAAVAALEATVDPGSAPALLGLVTSAAAAEAPATAAAEAPALGAAATSAPDAVTAAAAEKSSPASLSSDGEALTAALGGPPVFDGMDYSAPMEAFLAAVGLKDAAGVAAHLEDEFEAETGGDLGMLDAADVEATIEAVKLKKVSATKLREVWAAASKHRAEALKRKGRGSASAVAVAPPDALHGGGGGGGGDGDGSGGGGGGGGGGGDGSATEPGGATAAVVPPAPPVEAVKAEEKVAEVSPALSPEEEVVAEMALMGFPELRAWQAIEAGCSGTEAAVEWLLAREDDE